jgi:hypothetical protein
MIGGNVWASTRTTNAANTPVMAGVPTSPSTVEQSPSPNVQNPVGQVFQVSSRSPKRSHSESDGDDDAPVGVKRQKCDEATASHSNTVSLALRMKPQLCVKIPGSDDRVTTVADAVPQPAACKRKRQDAASHDELTSLLKKLRCEDDEPAAAKPKKSKSSWDSFDFKEFDNKSGKLSGSWNFDQLSYSDVKPRKLVACECERCSFIRLMSRYPL